MVTAHVDNEIVKSGLFFLPINDFALADKK